MTDNRIADRIAKMLNQAESTAGTPEGDIFEAKAFELMAQYGIDEAIVRASRKDEGATATRTSIVIRGKYSRQRMELAFGIAKSLHCEAVYSGSRGGVYEVHLFGMDSHIERVQTLFSILSLRLSDGIAAQQSPAFYNAAQTRSYRISWASGYIAAVRSRLRAAEREATKVSDDKGTGASLVLVSDAAKAKTAMSTAFPRTATSRTSRQHHGSAYEAGHGAGSRTDLGSGQVGGRRQALSA